MATLNLDLTSVAVGGYPQSGGTLEPSYWPAVTTLVGGQTALRDGSDASYARLGDGIVGFGGYFDDGVLGPVPTSSIDPNTVDDCRVHIRFKIEAQTAPTDYVMVVYGYGSDGSVTQLAGFTQDGFGSPAIVPGAINDFTFSYASYFGAYFPDPTPFVRQYVAPAFLGGPTVVAFSNSGFQDGTDHGYPIVTTVYELGLAVDYTPPAPVSAYKISRARFTT